jgi:hypothetical protein
LRRYSEAPKQHLELKKGNKDFNPKKGLKRAEKLLSSCYTLGLKANTAVLIVNKKVKSCN